MPSMIGNMIAIAVLTVVVTLAIRSMWKEHKNGGHCSGNCSQCSKCHSK